MNSNRLIILEFLKSRKGEQRSGAKYYKREWANNKWKYWYSKEAYDRFSSKTQKNDLPKSQIDTEVKENTEIDLRNKKDQENRSLDEMKFKNSSSNSKKSISFPLDLLKMKRVRIPKDIKSKGIDSPEYKQWVKENWSKDTSGESNSLTLNNEKIVNPRNVEEITLFHGSDKSFTEFDPNKAGSGDGSNLFGKGFYLTDNEKIAEHYAKQAVKNNYITGYQSGLIGSQDPIYSDEADKNAEKNKVINQFKIKGIFLDLETFKMDDEFIDFLDSSLEKQGRKGEKEYIQKALNYARENSDKIKNYRGELEYIFQRFVSGEPKVNEEVVDYLKNLGYDGIKFRSQNPDKSISKDSYDYVIYDPKIIIRSKAVAALERNRKSVTRNGKSNKSELDLNEKSNQEEKKNLAIKALSKLKKKESNSQSLRVTGDKEVSKRNSENRSGRLQEVPASEIKTVEQYTEEKNYNRKVIDGLKSSILAKGFDPGSPIKVDRDKNGQFTVVDGHHRFTAVKELISEGKLPKDTSVFVIEEKYDSESDRLLAQVSANKNKREVERLDDAKAYAKLVEQGKTVQEIAERTGESPEYVRGTIALNNLIPELKDLLRSDAKKNIRTADKFNDGSKEKRESIPETLAIVIAKNGIDDNGKPSPTIQRKAFSWYNQNKGKGISPNQVKSYIDSLKSQNFSFGTVDFSGRSEVEQEAVKFAGGEDNAKANSLGFENLINAIQKPIQKFLGDTITNLDEAKTKELAASIIATKGESALETELARLSDALNNIAAFRDSLKRKFSEIKSDSQTPEMFAFKSSMASILGFLKSRYGNERPGHKYINRLWKNNRWEYDYGTGKRNHHDDGSKIEQSPHHGGSNRDRSDFGKPYPEYSGKPMEGIKRLLKEKSGYIPDIVTRNDIGGIDFPYGKDGKGGFGLAHIIESRKKEKNSKYNKEADFLVLFQKLAKTLESGELHEVKNYPDRLAIVSKEVQFNEKVVAFIIKENGHWVLTGYEMPIHKILKKFSKFGEKNEG